MLTFFLYWNHYGGMRMDGVMSQRTAALVYLMWPLPCRQSTCVHTHAFGRTHTHRHIWVYDSKSWVWCVCEWVEDEEKGQRAPGDVVYPADRETEKESGRERGAWHCSSLSDGSSSGLRHGLPLISLSLDMKMEEKSRDEGGWRDQSRNLCWVLCQIDFYFILLFFYFKADNKTHLPTDTHTVDGEKQNWWVVTHNGRDLNQSRFSASPWICHFFLKHRRGS